MKLHRAFITGAGVISAAGTGWQANLFALSSEQRYLRPLTIFPSKNPPPLAGMIQSRPAQDELPATHRMAIAACQEALASGCNQEHHGASLDAVVVGTTTGGMAKSEMLLAEGESDPVAYIWHGAGTVAEVLAKRFACKGLTLTICNACSSSAIALKVCLELIRSGWAQRVLVCGVDALTRLTFHGFRLLQLIDAQGARPLDKNRGGMSLGEAAAAFLVSAGQEPPPGALAEIRGGGMTCDAYHPVAPHPQGEGAARAMLEALADAGHLQPNQIDYINLHGTGTRDNDASEAVAVKQVFGASPPPLSSSKGALGHTLGAAGALEAALCVMAIQEGIIPPNWGLKELDPNLGLTPVTKAISAPVNLALSNSIGFGGSNASIVIGSVELNAPDRNNNYKGWLEVQAASCLSGRGGTQATWEAFSQGKSCQGAFFNDTLSENLPPRLVRRWKRLPRLALALLKEAQALSPNDVHPDQVFFATGLGALSETYDFLQQLFDSDYALSSPIDFTGSVHNAPAGHVGQYLQAKGANLTFSGQDYSFEQALFATHILANSSERQLLLLGADEGHQRLTPLLDPPAVTDEGTNDGGGALILRPIQKKTGHCLRPLFYQGPCYNTAQADLLIQLLSSNNHHYGAIMAGIPATQHALGVAQLEAIVPGLSHKRPVIDYRALLGEHHTVAATATGLAFRLVQEGCVPAALAGGEAKPLEGRPLLLLALGEYIVASELY